MISRTPAVLSLVGLALFVLGFYLMMRVVEPSVAFEGMLDHFNQSQSSTINLDLLRKEAVPGVFGTYLVMTGSGFSIFVAGLAMLLGREQGD